MTLQSILSELWQTYMPGVSSNIDAKINHEYKKNKLPLPGDNNDSALAQVMHLPIREKLTGRKSPPDINEILIFGDHG